MMTPYPLYKAPHLDPALVQLHNRLLTRCSAWHCPFGSGRATWEVLSSPAAFTSAVELDISLGDAGWKAFLSDASCILRHEAFASHQGFEVESLPHEVQKAVLASLLAPALSLLQEASGKAAVLRNISLIPEKLPSEGIGFRITLSGDASLADKTMFAFLAPSEKHAAMDAAGMLAALPLRPNPRLAATASAVPLEVALETGYLFLDLDSVKTLETGDMLIPEAWPLSQGRAGLRIYHGISAVLVGDCTLREGSAVLETPLAEEVGNRMDNNDLEIRLSFELDRRLITVGELSSIAPGFTFPLANPADSLVTIRANGKAIARGRIVDMNGTLGVQITETL